MENVTKLEIKTDVAKTLEEFLEREDKYMGVIILGITKDHQPVIHHSSITIYQQSYLNAFFNAATDKIFKNAF